MKKILTICFLLFAFNVNAMEKETTFKKELLGALGTISGLAYFLRDTAFRAQIEEILGQGLHWAYRWTPEEKL